MTHSAVLPCQEDRSDLFILSSSLEVEAFTGVNELMGKGRKRSTLKMKRKKNQAKKKIRLKKVSQEKKEKKQK